MPMGAARRLLSVLRDGDRRYSGRGFLGTVAAQLRTTPRPGRPVEDLARPRSSSASISRAWRSPPAWPSIRGVARDLGQFFTPSSVARFMAAMPPGTREGQRPSGSSTPAAGAVFSLQQRLPRFCARPPSSRPDALHATVWEIDERLATDLARTFDYCRAVCEASGVRFTGTLRQENFILAAARQLVHGGLFTPQEPTEYHAAILNPPYRKLRSESAERAAMSAVGIETSNLYSAFVWLALRLLARWWRTRRDYASQLHERVVLSSVPQGARQRSGVSARARL